MPCREKLAIGHYNEIQHSIMKEFTSYRSLVVGRNQKESYTKEASSEQSFEGGERVITEML